MDGHATEPEVNRDELIIQQQRQIEKEVRGGSAFDAWSAAGDCCNVQYSNATINRFLHFLLRFALISFNWMQIDL